MNETNKQFLKLFVNSYYGANMEASLEDYQKIWGLLVNERNPWGDPGEYKPPVYTKPRGPQNIEFRPLDLNVEYRAYWNVRPDTEIVGIFKDGVQVDKNLYRIGGYDKWSEGYFQLLILKQEHYDEKIVGKKKNKGELRHLAEYHCVVNVHGDLLFVADEKYRHSLYQIRSFVWKYGDKVFNMDSGRVYTECASTGESFVTDEYVFVNVKYGNHDNEENGVIQISVKNQINGADEAFLHIRSCRTYF